MQIVFLFHDIFFRRVDVLESLYAVVFVLLLLLQLIKPMNEEALTPLLSTKKLDRYKIFSPEEWTTDLSEEIYLIGNNIILPKTGESFKFILTI